MGAKVAYLRCKYGVDFTNALNANINGINVFHQLDAHFHTVMNVLFYLRNCLRGTVETDGFSRNDIRQIMDCIYVNLKCYCCITITYVYQLAALL